MSMGSFKKVLPLIIVALLTLSFSPFYLTSNNKMKARILNEGIMKDDAIKLINKYSIRLNGAPREPYSAKYHELEFGGSGTFMDYPFMTTVVGDFFRLDYRGEFEIAKAKLAWLHGMGVKVILYMPFSSLSERNDFMYHWNLSPTEISPMDLNGTYYYDLPYRLGYEGREGWREFFVSFLRYIFDAGFDGIEFDGGDGFSAFGSFDPETMEKFKQYLASKYNASELQEKFNITDINSFNFTQYLRDLGYHHNAVPIDSTVIAHPGPDGPKDDPYAMALWEEFKKFNVLMLVELYKILMENVKQWEEETGREFYVSTRAGTYPVDLPAVQYVDAVNWEYCWIDYPNRTAGKDFRILQSLNKTFNPWIYPWSSLEATGFSEWFSYGWNKTMDPEEQYLALSELIVYGGRIPINPDVEDSGVCVNKTHFAQFIRLVQENPDLFGQSLFGELALIYPVATAINLEKLGMQSALEEGNFDSYEGTYYLLADSHRTFDIIVFGDNILVNITPSLSTLLKYKAIVLPEACCLTDDQVELLEQYVQSGGIIIGIGEIAKYNEYGEPVSRDFSNYFDGNVHQVGNGLIISILTSEVSPSQYLVLRTYHDPLAEYILNTFKSEIDEYVPPETWSSKLSERAHIYRFFNEEANSLIFDIINFNYDFEEDKVIREYNVDFHFKLPEQLTNRELSIWIYSEDYPEGFEVPYNITGDVVSITIPKLSILTVIEVRPHFEYYEPMIISEPKIYRGETLVLDRSLIVKSHLVFYDSEIVVRGGVKPIKIEMLPGGSLTLINSVIRKETGSYYIVARAGSRIVILNSEISGAGLFGPLDRGGLCIETKDAVILSSIIHDNYEFGILLFNADHSIIGNNLIFNNNVGVAIVNSSYIDFFNNTVINNNVGVCVESPDIYDSGVRLRKMIRMWERRKVPSRGAAKITISNCHISRNTHDNIVVIGCNFVTIKNSEISNSEGNNIFFWETSTLKVYNCTIHSARYGIYLEECPVNTILNNKIYNHSFAGILMYKCVYQGVLYWNHLENPAGDTRVIGNYIRNNTYGIYMDFGWGYFNADMRIQKNEISYNDVGVYVNLTLGVIYENNFIGNRKHAIVGPGGGQGWWGSGLFYLNISQVMYGFHDPPIGNYWDDWDKQTTPYEVCPGWYDYYPLDEPVEIPVINDSDGPLIAIRNYQKVWVNDTHYKITFDYLVTDQSFLGGSNAKDTLRYFGCYHFVGPYLRQLDPPYQELEFPWLGYPAPPYGEILGPEELTNTFRGSFESSIVNATWLKGAVLNLYIADMWGNWNRNDSAPPHIAFVYRSPSTVLEGNETIVYVLVSDWSSISNVTLMYSTGSSWISVEMSYDELTRLYCGIIPSQPTGTVVRYKVFAEDIYGNSYMSEEQSYMVKDLEGPEIKNVSWEPQEPTSEDEVVVSANITDPSGVKDVILSYNNGTAWINVTMHFNSETGLYEGQIPALPAGTVVTFRIYACDSFDNWSISEEYSYTVIAAPGKLIDVNLVISLATLVIAVVAVLLIVKKIRRRIP